MAQERSIPQSGKWTFHLQNEQPLQFLITPEHEAGDQVVIEGHDISMLLDYLYENRELIYEATHDPELRRLEEQDARLTVQLEERRLERIFFFDDGTERTRLPM
jgi:hypothetical protein